MKYVEKNAPRETRLARKDRLGALSAENEPLRQNAQNTTDPRLPDTPKPDLEKWQRTNMH
jgi:hypothetical protein